MATSDELILARKLLQTIGVPQSQDSLSDQAKDCVPLLEAIGYYDLADHLRETLVQNIRKDF